jgi:tripartite-type tricarboxylate transporter receptor subunit TctC
MAMLAVASGRAAAQDDDFYAGKTIRLLVGLQAGGTVDTLARAFAIYVRKHVPGHPNIVIQNMPGAAGANATNYLYERAAPDGLTILFGPWDPLAQVMGDQGLRAHYDQFEYLGGTAISA